MKRILLLAIGVAILVGCRQEPKAALLVFTNKSPTTVTIDTDLFLTSETLKFERIPPPTNAGPAPKIYTIEWYAHQVNCKSNQIVWLTRLLATALRDVDGATNLAYGWHTRVGESTGTVKKVTINPLSLRGQIDIQFDFHGLDAPAGIRLIEFKAYTNAYRISGLPLLRPDMWNTLP